MRSPIEQLRDRAIRDLPKPGQEAYAARIRMTKPQAESLCDMFPYLHGSSHGYGHQGPIRRRLQDTGLIKPKDDGWIPTRLGYQVIAILLKEHEVIGTLLKEHEEASAEDAEIKAIIAQVPQVSLHRDWDGLMRLVKKSSKPSSAISLVKKFLPGITYRKDETHPLGARFLLPERIELSDFYNFLKSEAETGARLGYAG